MKMAASPAGLSGSRVSRRRLSWQAQALQARHGAPLQAARQALAAARLQASASAQDHLAHATAQTVVPRPHWPVLALRLLLTAGPVLALLAAGRPQLMAFWQGLLAAWAAALQLPLQWQTVQASAEAGGGLRLIASALDDGTRLPTLWGLGGTALAGLLLWLGSARLPDAWLPLRVLLRALLLVQALALALVVLRPAEFPYTLGSHLSTLLNLGYGFLLAVPLLLALGWGVLALPLWQRLLVPAALVAWLAVLMPHKALLQVWLLAHSSVLFMPVLFVALGPLLDLMVFVALYGWLLSLRPAQATAGSTRAGRQARAQVLVPARTGNVAAVPVRAAGGGA